MKATICDLCKNIIPTIKIRSSGEVIELTITRIDAGKFTYDICSNCSKKVLNFLYNREG